VRVTTTMALLFGALAAIFLALAAWRLLGDHGTAHPQSRAWLLVGLIFAVVSVYLFYGT
jgi:hypothetical protein